jgi:polo-like kinase 1
MPSERSIPLPSVWVQKWIDYSSKYGLGYLLSDNTAGVFFNDSTKIVAEQEG